MGPLNITLAYILDLVLGDPQWFVHPVKIIGALINFLESKLRNDSPGENLRIKGVILTVVVVGLSVLCPYLFLVIMEKISPLAGTAAWIFLAYTTLATKDLFLHARRIKTKLTAKDLAGARQQLSHIVGRETSGLSESGVVKATVESIAENTNDGVIAPLFYLFLGGPVLAMAYKAVNTLDSMVGYKNEKYLELGWFSAQLDDWANFIPARLTGLLIPVAAFILRKDFKNSFKIMMRDGRKHPSPNSGLSEAAMAGALGIKLGGPLKPDLGDEKRAIGLELINEALTVTFAASLLMVITGVVLRWRI